MATTDARPGFKLPWSTERPESDSTDAAPEASPASTDEPVASHEPDAEDGSVATVEPVTPEEASPLVNETPIDTAQSPSPDPWRLGETPPAAVEPAPTRKPNRLMADLTKAMQTAAETTREETLARLQADAKAHVESIHTRSAGEAEGLRHTADADIAAIREWSKAEIARIREETDQKVVDRKATLEFEIEEHAARIEQRIERVQNHVALFENEMATFFERLLNEEDPTQLAAMAENLPEPPSFDDLGDLPAAAAPATVATPVEADAVADAVAEPAEMAATESRVVRGDRARHHHHRSRRRRRPRRGQRRRAGGGSRGRVRGDPGRRGGCRQPARARSPAHGPTAPLRRPPMRPPTTRRLRSRAQTIRAWPRSACRPRPTRSPRPSGRPRAPLTTLRARSSRRSRTTQSPPVSPGSSRARARSRRATCRPPVSS